MNTSLRQAIAVLGIIVLFTSLYWGTYVPYRKSELFIVTSRNLGKAKSVAALKQYINSSVDYSSPIGQDEVVQSFAETLAGVIQNLSQANLMAAPEILKYTESILTPQLEGGKGFGYTQKLFMLARANYIAWIKLGTTVYAERAEMYYEKCLEESPRRPQCLYGLFDLYRNMKSDAKAKNIAEEVLKFWPQDTRVKNYLSSGVFMQ